jgi:hypothetical protein
MIKRLFAVLLICGLSFVLFSKHSGALTIVSSRDCDDNAVIRCGARNFDELTTRYSNSGVAIIYSAFGINQQDISNIANAAVEGQVTKSGEVIVGGKVVATNAMTAGRLNMAGSTKVTSGGVIFYKRPPSVSFVSSSLPAFVVMNGDKFVFAIIASCGNPVIATPVVVKPVAIVKVKKAQATSTVQNTPAPPPTPSQTQSQTQVVSVNQTVATAPAPVAASAPAPATPAAQTLPNTGPGGVIGLTGAVTVFSSLGHFIYTRRRIA